MSEIMEKLILFFASHTYEKQVIMVDSLNHQIKQHRQLKHTVRINPLVLSWDEKVQK